MDLFIGRQPILNQDHQIVGYELLFRKGEDNFYSFEDGNEATLTVIGTTLYHIGLDKLVGNKKAYFNFTRDVLQQKFEKILPKDRVVIEILEDIELDDEAIEMLKDLKKRGYHVALDDVVSFERCANVLDYIDTVKVDWMLATDEELKRIPKELKDRKIALLAEKIETEDDFKKACEYGYEFFQGYFFSKPTVLTHKALPTRSVMSFELFKQVNPKGFCLKEASEMIKQEPALALNLLKFVNSAAMAFRERIKSVDQAVVLLGESNIRRWIVALIVTQACKTNSALINQAVERAKFCELLAPVMGLGDEGEALFLVGLFSLGERMLEQPMDKLVESIGVDPEIANTLLGQKTKYFDVLKLVEAQELADFEVVESILETYSVDVEEYNNICQEVIEWGSKATFAD
jgi:EAL and modified HD-GYP domain-containing signal transduction protein